MSLSEFGQLAACAQRTGKLAGGALLDWQLHHEAPAAAATWAQLRARPDLDKLIAFRIHGVSPDFIGQLQKLGYPHPEPDQLIAMRILGVTPDFITGLQSRGMKNLTVDQLVSLRIHGID